MTDVPIQEVQQLQKIAEITDIADLKKEIPEHTDNLDLSEIVLKLA